MVVLLQSPCMDQCAVCPLPRSNPSLFLKLPTNVNYIQKPPTGEPDPEAAPPPPRRLLRRGHAPPPTGAPDAHRILHHHIPLYRGRPALLRHPLPPARHGGPAELRAVSSCVCGHEVVFGVRRSTNHTAQPSSHTRASLQPPKQTAQPPPNPALTHLQYIHTQTSPTAPSSASAGAPSRAPGPPRSGSRSPASSSSCRSPTPSRSRTSTTAPSWSGACCCSARWTGGAAPATRSWGPTGCRSRRRRRRSM